MCKHSTLKRNKRLLYYRFHIVYLKRELILFFISEGPGSRHDVTEVILHKEDGVTESGLHRLLGWVTCRVRFITGKETVSQCVSKQLRGEGGVLGEGGGAFIVSIAW